MNSILKILNKSNKTNTITRFRRKIMDAKNILNLRIKPVDIRGAICRSHEKCVVARALLRQTGAKWVDVGANTVLVGHSNKSGKRYILPAQAKEQIRYFDTHDGAFAPCRLELRAPYAKTKLGNRTGIKARSGKPSHKKNKRQPTR